MDQLMSMSRDSLTLKQRNFDDDLQKQQETLVKRLAPSESRDEADAKKIYTESAAKQVFQKIEDFRNAWTYKFKRTTR